MSEIPVKHFTKIKKLSFKNLSLVNQQVTENLQTGLNNERNR